MKNIDKELEKAKIELDNLEVPDELEARLKMSLDGVKTKKRRSNHKGLILAAALALFFIGYNADAISYYGKKIIDYESVMTGTLKDLNELGSGQTIDKSYTFKDGIRVTLDGIMLDDNNIVAFYTIDNKKAPGNPSPRDISVSLESLASNYSGGGEGQLSDDGREMKWVASYNAPKFFEKTIKLSLYNPALESYGEIDFKLDRNQAIGQSIKFPIDKTIKLDDRAIEFHSLIASPISTLVKGSFQSIFDLALDSLKEERIYFDEIELQLLADGKEIAWQSGGSSTNLKGSYFHKSFDTLPEGTKELELVLKSLIVTEDIDEKVDLNDGTFPKTIDVLGRHITINKVYEDKGNTYINITSEEDVFLTSLFLNIDGKDIRNERTLDETFDKIVEAEEGKKILRSRTVEFKARGEDLELKIKKINYNKEFNQTIYSSKIK
nr:DUF4179 domain-containing protein [Tissierella sp.]